MVYTLSQDPPALALAALDTPHRVSIGIRPVDLSREGEAAFILRSWLRSYKNCSEFARRILPDLFFQEHQPLVKRILERSQTLIAHAPEDPETIFGFLTCEPTRTPPTLHFAFVKKEFRNFGIFSQLFAASGLSPSEFQFSHLTYAGTSLYETQVYKTSTKVLYNPYLI